MRLVFLFITILTGFDSYAFNYSGTVSKTGTSQIGFIDDSDKKTYQLTAATPLLATYLNRLSPGDFLSVEGVKDYLHSAVTVRSVNYVGLSHLLGNWFGDDSYCYNFVSFTEFSISRKIGSKCQPDNRPNYTYVISPTSDTWVIIISGQFTTGNYLGDVKIISSNEAQIQLYDPETGDTLRYVNLRK